MPCLKNRNGRPHEQQENRRERRRRRAAERAELYVTLDEEQRKAHAVDALDNYQARRGREVWIAAWVDAKGKVRTTELNSLEARGTVVV